ncbi:hypothetical protein F7725_002571, partial [Dissostichus mawsoni]
MPSCHSQTKTGGVEGGWGRQRKCLRWRYRWRYRWRRSTGGGGGTCGGVSPLDGQLEGDELEGLGHLMSCGSAPNIQEVGRCASVQLDDVHGGHRQSCSTPDGSIQSDVVQISFGCLMVSWIFLSPVLHREHLLLTVLCVRVEELATRPIGTETPASFSSPMLMY